MAPTPGRYSGTIEVSRRETWVQTWEITDTDDNLVDLAGTSIQVNVRSYNDDTIIQQAKTSNGTITVPSLGTFVSTISSLNMGTLEPENYEVSIVVTKSGIDYEPLRVDLTVI
jgi:hypothetical protein